MQFKKLVVIAGMLLSAVTGARADYTPVGVQNDVSYSDVINGGWAEVYRGDYGGTFSAGSVFDLIAAGSRVMLAGIAKGSQTFDVLASATLEEVTQWTNVNQTHTANGAEWYFNGSSIGFAGLGDTIQQMSADVVGSGQFGNDPNGIERDHLSWHSGGNSLANLQINSGWRSGSNVWLNSSSDFERVILVQTVSAVPEIETYAMMLVGMGFVGTIARRRKLKQD
jgi:hypothetical protein